ncbi:hypothetical protein ABTE60_19890, partial [Acinetobacter baumannii]
MFSRRWLHGSSAAILCAALVATGCSGGGGEAKPSGSSPAAATKGAHSEVGTYPIVNDKLTMSVFTRQDTKVEDYNTNEFTKFIEDKTNI